MKTYDQKKKKEHPVCLVLVQESTQHRIITALVPIFGSTEYRRGLRVTMTSFCLEVRLSKGQTVPVVDTLPLWISASNSSLIFSFVWRPLFQPTTEMVLLQNTTFPVPQRHFTHWWKSQLYFVFWGKPRTCYCGPQVGLGLKPSCLGLSKAGITGMCHCTQYNMA